MDVSEQLKSSPSMGKEDPCKRWQELFSKQKPKSIRKELMIRMLAYKIQEQAFGGSASRPVGALIKSLNRFPKTRMPKLQM